MLYPFARRIEWDNAVKFCIDILQPNRPAVRGMKNNGSDSVYRRDLEDDEKRRLTLNVERTLLLNS